MRVLGLLALALSALSGCQYSAEPTTTTAPIAVFVSDTQKIPGKYLLYIDASKFNQTIRSSDFTCIAHTFPVDLRSGFETAVRLTLQQLFETVEFVSSPVAPAQISGHGATGAIHVTGIKLEAKLNVTPGFLRNTMNTSVSLTTGVTVDGKTTNRLLGKTFEGNGEGQAGGGMACEGGSKALQASSNAAIAETTRRIAEAIAGSSKIRQNR